MAFFQVSPQFRGTALESDRQGKRRITRQRRHSLGSALASTANINKENTHCGAIGIAGHKKSKYKSLKFVGNHTTVASLVEEVDISCDTETTEDEEIHNQNRISDLETSCDDDPHIKRSRTNIKIGRRGDQIVLREISESNKKDNGIETTQNVGMGSGLDTHGSTPQGHTSTEDDATNLDHTNQLHVASKEQFNTNKRKHLNHKKKSKLKNLRKSIFNLSALSTDSDSSISGPETLHKQDENIEGTQRRYHVSVKSPVKRLFASQLRVTSPASIERNSRFPHADYSDSDNVCVDSSIAKSDDSHQKTPVRRSKRIAANLKKLAREGTPIGKTLKLMKVLVSDTPESEKGMSIRQKQLQGIM